MSVLADKPSLTALDLSGTNQLNNKSLKGEVLGKGKKDVNYLMSNPSRTVCKTNHRTWKFIALWK